MRILFFGDITGKPGRKAVKKILPEYTEQYKPDVIIANVENMAHGIGITEDTLQEMMTAGIQISTGGNHTFHKAGVEELLEDPSMNLLRPINIPPGNPGLGARVFPVGDKKLLVINAIGRVFAKESNDDPFRAVDLAIAEYGRDVDAIFVDFHAEATSEKRAFGFSFDGRVSAVVGTHTHIPSADAQLMPEGTAYQTDIGMCGPYPSVIGVEIEPVVRQFRTQVQGGLRVAEHVTQAEVGAVLVDTDGPTRSKAIVSLREIVTIEVDI